MCCRESNAQLYDLLVIKRLSTEIPTPPLPSKRYNDVGKTAASLLQKAVTFHSRSDQHDNSEQREMRNGDSNMTYTKTESPTQRNHSGDILTVNSIEGISSSSLSFLGKNESDGGNLGSTPETQSAAHLSDTRKECESGEQNSLSGFTKPHVIVTVKGHGYIEDLFLPPPPIKDISRYSICSPTDKRIGSPSTPLIPSPSHKKRSKSMTSSRIREKMQHRREKYCLPGMYVIYELTS